MDWLTSGSSTDPPKYKEICDDTGSEFALDWLTAELGLKHCFESYKWESPRAKGHTRARSRTQLLTQAHLSKASQRKPFRITEMVDWWASH